MRLVSVGAADLECLFRDRDFLSDQGRQRLLCLPSVELVAILDF